MPRPRVQPRRQRRPLSLIGAAALAWAASAACAEERAPGQGCADCGIHPAGVLDPASPDFHGAELARRDWDFALCASCHGSDFTGGAAGVSCVTCHAEGPTACSTCHGEKPDSGAHAAHLGDGPSARTWACGECHQVPTRWDDEGHIRRAGVTDPPPAEVEFAETSLAAATPGFAVRRAPPGYDPASGQCSDVYCHGDALGDGGGALTRPSWAGHGEQAACGTCHGDPPASHADDRCDACHAPAEVGHIDGELTIGGGSGCTGCHGSDDSPAPPSDLEGNLLTSAIGVGAHRSHLDGGLRLRGPLACGECHAVPAAIDSPGHIDSAAPAEVALVGGGQWDRAAVTCASWCHGQSQPIWTRVGQGEVFCGSCHGVPPDDSIHAPDLELSDCAGCHPGTVDGSGNILFSGPPGAETSQHMDGNVDL
ncbi:MAG TPA: CxxxxCH/CxxCH domain-containing protein [Kofleriaceae bacterium]|nr:CxxxxCH/CxxCH domain-containing protein [Kofleriaceae bacterium]